MNTEKKNTASKSTVPERAVLWKLSLVGTILVLVIALLKIFLGAK